ncbi:MAG TPA: TrkH family potassium uptake protein, partial [Candidatus Wunengus sp. YC63]|uniref:TrkH family potassium uptake protein n=1 Tax=Candidatus Wunengus sp. YC63 TaxID=3367699 RepID=UPI004028F0A2
MFYSTMTPHRFLLLGFVCIILVGSFLLSLPIASVNGTAQPFIDALFVATSAASTTGLTVVDVSSFYSLFGQIVILVLIQIGGLGYMIFVVTIVLQLGGKLSLGGKLVLEESVSSPPYEEVSRFSRAIIFITLIFEFLGAAALSLYWMKEFPVKHAIYLGIFHSVSAFCTAGFSLFSDNLRAYRDSIVINVTIGILCIVGSVGFFVIYDVYNMVSRKRREDEPPKKLLIHTKLVLIMLPILIITGACLICLSEWNTPLPSFKDRFLTSTFQAISAST